MGKTKDGKTFAVFIWVSIFKAAKKVVCLLLRGGGADLGLTIFKSQLVQCLPRDNTSRNTLELLN
jgi:hypothetical protein